MHYFIWKLEFFSNILSVLVDGNDIFPIQTGFQIRKLYDEVLETLEQLQDGELQYNNPKRVGSCHKPITQWNLNFFVIVYQKLKSFDHCLKILNHLAPNQRHTWSESNTNVKLLLVRAKKKVISKGIRFPCRFTKTIMRKY